MSAINYSKWDHIEVSDDEDETHPNIDTPSLFRWRHQARVDRMEEAKQEKENFQKGVSEHQSKKEEMKRKIAEAEEANSQKDALKYKTQLTELEKQDAEWKEKEKELTKKEKLTPWNVDTLSHDAWTKTIINRPAPKLSSEQLTEEEQAERHKEFVSKNEKQIKKYGMMQKWDDSKSYLNENKHLVSEYTANYLVIWCVDLQVEEKVDLMHHVAHQTIVMQYLLELAKQLERDPRSCINPFFQKIKSADKTYMDAFEDELRAFKGRVKDRADARIERAMKEYEEEERQKRLGPGGLDPIEVLESLPQEMKDCFEKQDVAMLQQLLREMPEEDAKYHMKRCVDSGLWVPDESAKSLFEDPPSS